MSSAASWSHRAWALVAIPAIALAACGGGDEATDAGDTATTDPGPGDATATAAETDGDGTVDDQPEATATTPLAVTTPDTASHDTSAPSTAPATAGTTSAPSSAAPGSDPGNGPTADGLWVDPEGVYAIAYPSEPSAQVVPAPLPDGSTMSVTAHFGEVEGAAIVTSCLVPPGAEPGIPARLDAVVAGALGNFGAQLVASEPIELQGRPGVEFRGAIGEAGAVLARAYANGDQVCQAIVIGDPAAVDTFAPSFLDSFEFLQEGP
jgi:hypothetical protein